MKKVVGYILAGIGLIGLIFFSFIKDVFLISIGGLGDNFILILSLILIILGIIILFLKEKKVIKEVPIFEGKKIVGYRRQS